MIIVIPLLILLIVIICLINHYIKINREATTFSGILFSVAVYLCIIPIVIECFGDYQLKKANFWGLNNDIYHLLLGYLSLIVFLLSFTLAYSYGFKKNNQLRLLPVRIERYSKRVSYITFFVGGISFLIYASLFGGILQLLINAEFLRSFSTDKSVVTSSWEYILVIPAGLINVSPYLFIIYRKYARNKFLNSIFIISSVIGTILFLLSGAGKTGIILFALSFAVPLMSYKFKHKWLLTIFMALIGIELINYLDALFIWLATGDFAPKAGDGILSYLSQFSYPVNNLMNLDDIANVSGYRFGQDFITGILNIIPGVNFEPSYVPTSYFYSGQDWKIKGGVPNDLITFGYLQFGVLGVAFVAYLLGLICARIDSCFRLFNSSFASRLLKYTLVILFFQLFVSGDIITIVRNKFTLIFLSILIIYSTRLSSSKALNK